MSQTKKPEFETILSVRPSTEMLAKIHSLVEECVKRELDKTLRKLLDEKLEGIVRKCLEEKEKHAEMQVVELKKISKSKALSQIKAYIDKHQGCRTSDIIYDLALNPDLVLKVLKELKEKSKIRSEG